AIEPMRRMERPLGSTLLPGRVSPYPSTTDSSPRTTASTRPGAPELSHITAPAMDAASLRTISAARAGFAGAPAASIAKITAGRYLFNLGVMALASRGRLSQDSMDERGERSRRRASVASNVCRGVDMNGHKHERTWVPPLPDASLAWATTQISKKCKGRRYMLATSSLEYVSVRHDHA